MSLVDADEVPLAKSPCSANKTDSPRPTASRATPQPLMPPPMIARSRMPPSAFPWVCSCQAAAPGHRRFIRLRLNTKRRLSNFFERSSLVGDLDGDVALSAQLAHALRRLGLGDEIVELGDMTDAHRRGALELHAIGDQNGFAGAVHDGLRHLHLAIIEVEQRAVLVDGGRADHGVVDLELTD